MPVTTTKKKKKKKKRKKRRKKEEEERTDHKCLWQRKKDQTTFVDGKRKIAALIRQANS